LLNNTKSSGGKGFSAYVVLITGDLPGIFLQELFRKIIEDNLILFVDFFITCFSNIVVFNDVIIFRA